MDGENNGKTLLKWMIWGYHHFRKPLDGIELIKPTIKALFCWKFNLRIGGFLWMKSCTFLYHQELYICKLHSPIARYHFLEKKTSKDHLVDKKIFKISTDTTCFQEKSGNNNKKTNCPYQQCSTPKTKLKTHFFPPKNANKPNTPTEPTAKPPGCRG